MTQEKTVQTSFGPFDRRRYKSLCRLLAESDKIGMERDETVMFEGQELVISVGQELRNFLDTKFAMRGHEGL